jgi:hypothetical protein
MAQISHDTKAESKLNGKILLKIQEIKDSFPELITFLNEMRVDSENLDDKAGANTYSSLSAYYDSLDALLTSHRTYK